MINVSTYVFNKNGEKPPYSEKFSGGQWCDIEKHNDYYYLRGNPDFKIELLPDSSVISSKRLSTVEFIDGTFEERSIEWLGKLEDWHYYLHIVLPEGYKPQLTFPREGHFNKIGKPEVVYESNVAIVFRFRRKDAVILTFDNGEHKVLWYERREWHPEGGNGFRIDSVEDYVRLVTGFDTKEFSEVHVGV